MHEAARRVASFSEQDVAPVTWSIRLLGDSVRACQPEALRAVRAAAARAGGKA